MDKGTERYFRSFLPELDGSINAAAPTKG